MTSRVILLAGLDSFSDLNTHYNEGLCVVFDVERVD
jgi:hypothetical protein